MRRVILISILALGCSDGNRHSLPEDASESADRKDDEHLQILKTLERELGLLLYLARPEEVCFVSFKTAEAPKPTDPPEACLRLVKEFKQRSVAASAGELRDDKFCDKKSGKPGVRLSICFNQMKDENEFAVSLAFFRGGLDAAGYTVRVVRESKGWIKKETLKRWYS